MAGESENYDIEQEHLNNVFGGPAAHHDAARAAGPGIELLEYLAPRWRGRRRSTLRANDLAHWQTTLITPGAGRSSISLLPGRHSRSCLRDWPRRIPLSVLIGDREDPAVRLLGKTVIEDTGLMGTVVIELQQQVAVAPCPR